MEDYKTITPYQKWNKSPFRSKYNITSLFYHMVIKKRDTSCNQTIIYAHTICRKQLVIAVNKFPSSELYRKKNHIITQCVDFYSPQTGYTVNMLLSSILKWNTFLQLPNMWPGRCQIHFITSDVNINFISHITHADAHFL